MEVPPDWNYDQLTEKIVELLAPRNMKQTRLETGNARWHMKEPFELHANWSFTLHEFDPDLPEPPTPIPQLDNATRACSKTPSRSSRLTLTPSPRAKLVKITGEREPKAESLEVEQSIGQGSLVDAIALRLGEPRSAYTLAVRDRNGRLRTTYEIAPEWSYTIVRVTPETTIGRGNQEERRQRGNQTSVLINRSSDQAWKQTKLNVRTISDIR
jgi:hypothetical protein